MRVDKLHKFRSPFVKTRARGKYINDLRVVYLALDGLHSRRRMVTAVWKAVGIQITVWRL